MSNLGLYIHIPFCAKKCDYCDFLSFENTDEELQKRYVKTLVTEINMRSEELRNRIVDTIFIGGGTPSILKASQIKEIIDAIKEKFNIAVNSEITIEANPGTVTPEKLEIYRKSGINRLSIGAQSLDNECLNAIGRIHSAEELFQTFADAREAGFSNINIDLMFSLPKQTAEKWESTLKKALALSPEHISFYSLQIEENTRFHTLYKNGKLEVPSDEEDRYMYRRAVELMEDAGYLRYEISNGSKPGYSCRHNIKYWSFDDYLGMGLGAHSFLDGLRFSNTTEIETYFKKIEAGDYPVEWKYKNTFMDSAFEYVFTGLRKAEGFSLEDFKNKLGVEFLEYYGDKRAFIEENIKNGMMFLEKGYLGLTLNGVNLSNGIMSQFSKEAGE